MGDIVVPEPVRPLAGLLCTVPEELALILSALSRLWGAINRQSQVQPFAYTRYYESEMGPDLWRQYVVFDGLFPSERLVEWKRLTNDMEQRFGLNGRQGRRVNIDPGYLAPGKLVLASTKDFAHRLYLGQGIYGEITLKIEKRKFTSWPWTYPDYADMAPFFDEAYQDYLTALKSARPQG